MRWLEDFVFLMQSHVAAIRDRFSDPERMLHQLIVEMETDLEAARKRVVEAIHDEEQIARELDHLEATVNRLVTTATEALRNGDEALAKFHLKEKQVAQDRQLALREIERTQREQTRSLQAAFSDLEQKIAQARRKHRMVLAQHAVSDLQDDWSDMELEQDSLWNAVAMDPVRNEDLEREFEELKRRVQG